MVCFRYIIVNAVHKGDNRGNVEVFIYPLVISVEGAVTISFLKCLQTVGLTKSNLRVCHIAVLLQMSHSTQIPGTRPLISGGGLNFLPLTDRNPNVSLGYVKCSQQIHAEKCD